MSRPEFIRSQNLWFRPIENRVGPDGALYIVDFCNQAVIHNDTRGPTHGPANAAVRPDRDHYYGRIWKVQHKEAKAPAATAYRNKPESKGTQGSKALLAYEAAKQAANADKLLQDFAAAQDDWTRSALIAAAAEKPAKSSPLRFLPRRPNRFPISSAPSFPPRCPRMPKNSSPPAPTPMRRPIR